MFGRKKKHLSIPGFAEVKYGWGGTLTMTIEMFVRTYKISLEIQGDSDEVILTPQQEAAIEAYFEKREDIEDLIREYYVENWEEILETGYIPNEPVSGMCCDPETDFHEIIGKYTDQDRRIDLLLTYFAPQSLFLWRNGYCALVGFLARLEDTGFAPTITPEMEIMTQVEYFDVYWTENHHDEFWTD
ncbi:MAG: hypothetical protein LBG81_00435 [Coriobacteriaceae bacterium]|nr:hypothetical protein [Coriobacteriaceae bacterium]